MDRGREQPGGAITGTVYLLGAVHIGAYSEQRRTAKRIGSYRIEPDGTVTRWPGMPAAVRRAVTVNTTSRQYTLADQYELADEVG